MDKKSSIDELHAQACERGDESYVDPLSGYRVFTSVALSRREACCGSVCRHCPFQYENVDPVLKKQLRRSSRNI